jgi:phospholipid/cholesterol/gamma-HCH transport system ATP-binding protein
MVSGDIAISVRGIETRFGAQVVHSGLDLDVFRGEILGVIGPSGCGKSVLMRQIVGLDEPQAGDIRIFGETLAAHGDGLASRVGVLFQDGALFSTLTVKENVEVPLKVHTRLSPLLIGQIADLKLSLSGLGAEAYHKKPSEISGGMRKRAALARALALDPELLFLDEPTAGLDPVTASGFDRLVKDLSHDLGLTVFLVTHDLDTLMGVCDRVAVLYGGKVAAIGPVEEVRANASGWVKEYFAGPRGRAAQAERAVEAPIGAQAKG